MNTVTCLQLGIFFSGYFYKCKVQAAGEIAISAFLPSECHLFIPRLSLKAKPLNTSFCLWHLIAAVVYLNMPKRAGFENWAFTNNRGTRCSFGGDIPNEEVPCSTSGK